VFLDRDGTLIDDPGYLRDPDQVRLLPGVANALGRLQRGGFKPIVVTNQSGIGRGLISPEEFSSVMARLGQLLQDEGVTLAGSYHCPHLPQAGCDCRKPGLALYLQAIDDNAVDPAASWWLGDRLSDVSPAVALGGRGVLLETGEGLRHRDEALAAGHLVAADLSVAADLILTRP